jgi:hypothetical protein
MTTDTRIPAQLNIEELLVRVIGQGNGASRHEILRRQMALNPIPKLSQYLYEELGKMFDEVQQTSPPIPDGTDLDEIELSDDPDHICVLARRLRRDGFEGQNMRDPARAAAYIGLAADNPRVMDELPASGLAFWKSAEFHYRLWKKQKTGETT